MPRLAVRRARSRVRATWERHRPHGGEADRTPWAEGPSAPLRAGSTSDCSPAGWRGVLLHPSSPHWQAPAPALVYAMGANPRTCPGPQTKLSPRATTRREALWRGFVLTAIWRSGARWPISWGGCGAEPLALHSEAAGPDQGGVDRSGAPGRPAPRNNWLLGATVAGSSRILRGKHIGGAGTGHRSRLTVRNPEFSQRTSREIPVQREGCRHAAARMKEHRPGRAPDGAPAARCLTRCR